MVFALMQVCSNLHFTVPLKIPPGGEIAGGSPAIAPLLSIYPHDLAKNDPDGFRRKVSASRCDHLFDQTVLQFIFHEFYFVGTCPVQGQ
jgi:hypothetical protein